LDCQRKLHKYLRTLLKSRQSLKVRSPFLALLELGPVFQHFRDIMAYGSNHVDIKVLQQKTSRLEQFIVTAVDLAASSSGLRGRMRTYRPIFKLADHALCKMVRHVLLRPLRLELLAAKSTARR
jgi:hypothetical protein